MKNRLPGRRDQEKRSVEQAAKTTFSSTGSWVALHLTRASQSQLVIHHWIVIIPMHDLLDSEMVCGEKKVSFVRKKKYRGF